MGAIAPIDFEKCPVARINFPKILVSAMDFDSVSLIIGLKRSLAPID